MKGNELVWRTLADAALGGQRRWASVGELADEAGVPSRTGYLALEKLIHVGAVKARSPGIATTNPEKVLTILAAHRNLPRDTLATTTVAGIWPLLDSSLHPYAIGGTDAAVTHLENVSSFADFGQWLVYLPEAVDLSDLPAGEEVRVVRMDARARRNWINGFTSLAQTYADLFASPGRSADELRRALWTRHFSVPDWDQQGPVTQ